MFYIRKEGEAIQQGLNFYPLSGDQVGVVVKLFNKVMFFRYSKLMHRFRFHSQTTS
jgi:hypothetical protein